MQQTIVAPEAGRLHDQDLVLWAREQTRLLREGRLGELDLANLVGEAERVGASQSKAIEDRMVALLTRLIMWKYQPGARLASWRSDIAAERRRIARLIGRAPSLAAHPQEIFQDCYRSGRLRAAAETGIDRMVFPDVPPFTLVDTLDEGFLPLEPDLEAYR